MKCLSRSSTRPYRPRRSQAGERNRRARRRAFTLVEVLLVLAILVMIGGIAATSVFRSFSKAKVNTAKATIEALESPIELFMIDIGQPPTTQQGLQALRTAPPDLPDPSAWNGPYLKKEVPKDPWGNDYIYEYLGNGQYRITSAGPDGQVGTPDDISSGG